MSKKSSGNSYTSKGERKNVNGSILSGVRSDRLPMEKIINTQKAWLKGQNPWVTIDNPSKEQPGKLKLRVKANDLWGSPKERLKKMYIMPGTGGSGQ